VYWMLIHAHQAEERVVEFGYRSAGPVAKLPSNF
jgi:hypothetical protein